MTSQKKEILDFVRIEVKALKAYKIEHKRLKVKLDANENNNPLPRVLEEKIGQAILRTPLHLYPSGHADILREKISYALGISKDQIVVGNGSNELIQMITSVFTRHGDESRKVQLVIPSPTFGMYPITGNLQGMKITEVPLKDDFSLDAPAMQRAIENSGAGLVILSYPNNPTGNCFDEKEIKKIMEIFPGPVVIDEAYNPFSKKTFLGSLPGFPNLIILRTLSKFGFAGLRVGYAVASEEIVSELMKVKLPFNLNALSEAIASVVFENLKLIEPSIEEVIRERERVMKEMKKIEGITPFPSCANFILFRTSTNADEVQKRLFEDGISIRNFNRGGILRDCLRVTIGTHEENSAFIEGLKKI